MHVPPPFNTTKVLPYLAPAASPKKHATTSHYAAWACASAKRLAYILNPSVYADSAFIQREKKELLLRESVALMCALALFTGRTLKAALGVATLAGACLALAYQYFKRQPQ